MNSKRAFFSLWRIDLMSFGLVAFAGLLTSLTQGGDEAPPTAVGLMQRAHDGRAVWREFPGFRAAGRASVDGVAVEGTLQVNPSG